jgi:hypothetical protein
MFGNFYFFHLRKPTHLRAAGVHDDEELPEAAPAEALAGTGVGFLPDEAAPEAAPATLPEDESVLHMVPDQETALRDLLAYGLKMKGGILWCRLCAHELGPATDGRVIPRARGHVSGAEHLQKAQAATGQQSLAQFGFSSAEPEIKPCLGFHEDVVQYGDSKYDVALIIARDLSNEDFVTEKGTMWEYQRTRNGAPCLVRGCIRARGCKRIALDSLGIGPRILSCALCKAVPKLNSFRMLARQQQFLVGALLIGPSTSVNFDKVSPAELVQIASSRARSGRHRMQCRLRRAIGQQRQPSVRPREPCSNVEAAVVTAAAAVAAEGVTYP